MDAVRIEGLQVQARVGVTEAERSAPQAIRIDLELMLDLEEACRTQRLDATVDYAAVSVGVRRLVEAADFVLVEAMGLKIADWILEGHPVERVTVTLRKFSVPRADSVGVRITRDRPRKNSPSPKT